ncbi:hypothetical protein GF337_15930 [candidate division KSB1 bacterium]|nr:hypothetical protein [candidate division KSB1 bacterium]
MQKIRLKLCFIFTFGVITNLFSQVPFEHKTIENEIGHTQICDIDDDGQDDIVLHIHTITNKRFDIPEDRIPQLCWYKWQTMEKYTIATGDFTGDRFEIKDINGDRYPDIISAIRVEDKSYEIVWFQNPLPVGDPRNPGDWKEHPVGTQEGYPKDIIADYVNDDLQLDIAVRTHESTSIYFQNRRTWSVCSVTHPPKEGMALADLDYDGDRDIVLNGFWLEMPSDPFQDEFTFHNIDKKWYTQNTPMWRDNCCYVGATDINKDGLWDVVLAHSESAGYPLSWYTIENAEQIKTGPWIEHKIVEEFDWCETVDFGDVDLDGTMDVIAAKFQRGLPPGHEHGNDPPFPVTVFYNKAGDGSQWERQDIFKEGIYAGILGDIGGDGDLDITGPRSFFKGPIDIFENKLSDQKLSLDNWTYIQVDSTKGKWGDFDDPPNMKYFGLGMADVTGDGFSDIVSGRYFYRNPGNEMNGTWSRIDLGMNVDGYLFYDVDDDQYGDIIALALPNVYWFEAENADGTSWEARKVGEVTRTGHVNSQGVVVGQIEPGGKPEIIINAQDGVYYFVVPNDPANDKWIRRQIAGESMDEGVGVGDMDGDGDFDIVVGKADELSRYVVWYENPATGNGNWDEHLITTTNFAPDRIRVADLNNDGLNDVVITEERVPGRHPDASLYWVEQRIERGRRVVWLRHTVVTQYSMNSLDLADMDRDGDTDIITCEHKGPHLRLQIWENDGRARFTEHLLDQGKESHLGSQVADMDGDGDFDIVSTGWAQYKHVHLWRNNAISPSGQIKRVKWTHLNPLTGKDRVPLADVGKQAALLVFDIDKDGKDDIVVAGWGHVSMVWIKKTATGWKKYLIDNKHSHIEAGGDYYDIDGDGDLDILQGGSWATNEVWWWENPHPKFDPQKPWKRYTIKSSGAKQHHDQIFGDFDGDGQGELVFWNQRAQKLYIADIPKNPKEAKNWKLVEIWSWQKAFKYEGFAKADIDQDGIVDLIGGGYWFKHLGSLKFQPNQIDDYGKSRSAAGDFIKGGRPEIVLGSGDGAAPLYLYEWKDGSWEKHTLIHIVDHGHTLQVADINGDGNLDIYTAEMYRPGPLENCKQWILYGDGAGNFDKQVLSIGLGTHEGKLGDVDGDGDVDIVQKDFQEHRRIDVWLNEGVKY